MKQIINCETGEIVERELSEEELTQEIKDRKETEKTQTEQARQLEAKAAARLAILDRLGLNEEEAKLLLG